MWSLLFVSGMLCGVRETAGSRISEWDRTDNKRHRFLTPRNTRLSAATQLTVIIPRRKTRSKRRTYSRTYIRRKTLSTYTEKWQINITLSCKKVRTLFRVCFSWRREGSLWTIPKGQRQNHTHCFQRNVHQRNSLSKDDFGDNIIPTLTQEALLWYLCDIIWRWSAFT